MQLAGRAGSAQFTDRVVVTKVPIGKQHTRLAEGIGMQLALNEGANSVIVLDAEGSGDLASIDQVVRRLGRDELQIMIADGPKNERVKLALSRRCAFVAGLWAQMTNLQQTSGYDDLAWVLAKIGQKPWTFRAGVWEPYKATPRRFSDRKVLEFFWATGMCVQSVVEPPPRKAHSVAVITPYYKEHISKLRRCHESVLQQSGDRTHFMIADGFPNPEVDRWNVQHVCLSVAHGDNGDTPRGVGALLAFARGFDAVAFLDADNWLADNHISSMLRTQRRREANVVCSSRHIVLPDDTLLDQMDPEDVEKTHVDTSCLLFTAERRFLACLWSRMPKFCGPICDRVVFSLARQFKGLEHTGKQTVFFESNYSEHFRMAGRPLPDKVNDFGPELYKRMHRPDDETREDFWRCTGQLWPFASPRRP